jgi:hypothetical protein
MSFMGSTLLNGSDFNLSCSGFTCLSHLSLIGLDKGHKAIGQIHLD